MALNVNEANSFHPYKNVWFKTPTIQIPETASSTFKKGSPVIYTSNRVAEAVASSPSILGITDSPGNNKAANNTTNLTRVIPAFQGQLFTGIITTSAGGYSLVQGDIGTLYGIAKDATNLGWYVDQGNTTNLLVRVITAVNPADIGGTNTDVRVIFSFITVQSATSLVRGSAY